MNYTVFINYLKSVSNISFSKELLDKCFIKLFTLNSEITINKKCHLLMMIIARKLKELPKKSTTSFSAAPASKYMAWPQH